MIGPENKERSPKKPRVLLLEDKEMDGSVKTKFYCRNTGKSLVYPKACWSTTADTLMTPYSLFWGGG